MRRLVTTSLITVLASSGAPFSSEALAQGSAGVQPLDTDLRYLVEEEKLARDVYRALYARWRLPIFDNISRSEQRHMEQLRALLHRRGLQAQDPTSGAAAGTFTNKELARQYRALVTRGSASEKEALLVGATIEDLDIRDIKLMERRTTDRDALGVFARLKCGSRNHMRAFTRQLTALGVTYRAQYISSTALGIIVGAPCERCGRQGQQGNRGQGWRGGGGGGEGRGGGGQGWRGGRGGR